MIRIGLSARLVAIAGTALLAIWVTLLSSLYLANGLRSAAALPAPGKAAVDKASKSLFAGRFMKR